MCRTWMTLQHYLPRGFYCLYLETRKQRPRSVIAIKKRISNFSKHMQSYGFFFRRWVLKEALLLVILCVSLVGKAFPQNGLPSHCMRGEWIPLNTNLLRVWEPDTRSRSFRIQSKQSGLISIHASSPSEGPSVRVGLREERCIGASSASASYEVVWRTPKTIMLWISSPGYITFVVAPQDPTRIPKAVALHTVFADEELSKVPPVVLADSVVNSCAESAPELTVEPIRGQEEFRFTRTAGWSRDVEPWECDVLELRIGGVESQGVFLWLESEGVPLRATLYEGGDCMVSRKVVDGVLQDSSDTLRMPVLAGELRLVLEQTGNDRSTYSITGRSFDLCKQWGQDDHGDSPYCATPVLAGEYLEGRLDGATGDFEDYFTFSLDHVAAFKAEFLDAEVVLYDALGQRLSYASCGEGRHRGIAQTLRPGRYFISVSNFSTSTVFYSGRVMASRIL